MTIEPTIDDHPSDVPMSEEELEETVGGYRSSDESQNPNWGV